MPLKIVNLKKEKYDIYNRKTKSDIGFFKIRKTKIWIIIHHFSFHHLKDLEFQKLFPY